MEPNLLEDLSHKIIPQQPIFTSKKTGWQNVFLAYYQHPRAEICQHTVPFHVLEVIDPTSSSNHERRFGNNFLSYKISGGETCFCPAHTHHWTSWEEQLNFTVLVFEPRLFEQLASETLGCEQIEFIPQWQIFDPVIQTITNALKADLNAGCPAGRLYGESFAMALITHLIKQFTISKRNHYSSFGELPKHKLKTVLDYIQANLTEDITLEELAKVAGISQFYFARLFKKSMHLPPHQYILRQRIELAKQLLQQPEYNITDVALQCGFAHPTHLSRHFRRLVGMSPSDFKKL
ncbi:transcriptional regulator containing an amidase domain and an AraC-type DNA-binding HTH domain [Nostoc sp. PCC 7524]|uniref:helix-turn-helix domain-containing protein n=1 Tax=Nostoc sp. (strain ATCC 29411 / PCC 7524) TaxID=28072 RepID=UPI00029F05D9|nr:AraC family transcriptional regulator [Nostoc sp. PCC 7524]AFY47048.1 transcriptional regulator containing an amidase domain and an AraC-type DNA-binding HTH domain [Nostoc sp. PCC 7524]